MITAVAQKIWTCRGRTVQFGSPLIMGILNVTPDSFYADSRTFSTDLAVQRAASFVADGAQLLDIGGESTRPGAKAVSIETECERVIPVLTALRHHFPSLLLSVDTRHTATAAAALAAGADIINDVSGLTPDHGMLELIARTGAGYILTHANGLADAGTPLTDPTTCTEGVRNDLLAAAQRAEAVGVSSTQIQLDPGLGFAKSHAVSAQLLRDTQRFAQLPYSLMIAASRKRFLGALTGHDAPERRGAASLGAALWAVQAGANVLRVHDVRETTDALTLFLSLNSNEDQSHV